MDRPQAMRNQQAVINFIQPIFSLVDRIRRNGLQLFRREAQIDMVLAGVSLTFSDPLVFRTVGLRCHHHLAKLRCQFVVVPLDRVQPSNVSQRVSLAGTNGFLGADVR